MYQQKQKSALSIAVSVDKPGVLRQPGVLRGQHVGCRLGRGATSHLALTKQEEEEKASW